MDQFDQIFAYCSQWCYPKLWNRSACTFLGVTGNDVIDQHLSYSLWVYLLCGRITPSSLYVSFYLTVFDNSPITAGVWQFCHCTQIIAPWTCEVKLKRCYLWQNTSSSQVQLCLCNLDQLPFKQALWSIIFILDRRTRFISYSPVYWTKIMSRFWFILCAHTLKYWTLNFFQR